MLLDILEEHYDEAVALFERWLAARARLDYTDTERNELLTRLRAHLDGLLLAGEQSWSFCQAQLAAGGPGDIYVSALFAFEGEQAAWLDAFDAALPQQLPRAAAGLHWAARHTAWPAIDIYLLRLLRESTHQHIRACALETLAAHGVDPGSALQRTLRAPSAPAEVRAALCAVATLRLTGADALVMPHLDAQDPAVAAAALQALAAITPQAACAACREALAHATPAAPTAAELLGNLGGLQDVAVLTHATTADDYALARAALLALGELGYATAIPALIDALEHPRLGGVATCALRRMLGGACPAEEVAAAAANDDEATWHPDDELPRLSLLAVQRWWAEHQAGFAQDTRLREGRPLAATAATEAQAV